MASSTKEPFEMEFQRNSQKVFKENTEIYNSNDIDYLRKLKTLYGDAVNARGLNVADPFEANMFHYNKLGFKGNIDHPRVTKTYVFFTRPELNFSFENINSVPFFKWLFAQDIGKMIMASLTDPEYFINAPTAFNTNKFDEKQFIEALTIYKKEVKEFEKRAAESSKEDGFYDNGLNISEGQDYSGLTDDDAEDVEELNSISLDSLEDENVLNMLSKNADTIQRMYTDFYGKNGSSETIAKALSYGVRSETTGPNAHYSKILNEHGLFQAKSSIFASDNDEYYNTTPFIPLLSNITTNLDGSKDLNLELYGYEEDDHGTSVSVATGMDSVWKEGDFTTQIEDIAYSPGALLCMAWILYIHYVSRGYIMPTREHITERILDYTCSAYIFVIGEDGRRIERFGKFTGCFPTSFPLSQQLLHSNQIDIDMLHKFSINWHFNRYTPMDPQIFTDFNFLSQTEWLVKLKEPFWEDLYKRGSESKLGVDESTFDKSLSTNEQIITKALNRPGKLWELIKRPGMSGKLPTGMFPDSRRPNNFWGGYPFIYKGREFIWVQPNYINVDLTPETKIGKNEDSAV